MFKKKFVISTVIFFSLLIITSSIKNKTRSLEKQITSLNVKILAKEKNLNETQLDFHYLSSPDELEKRINMIGFYKYQPINHSKIFFQISDFNNIQNKISNYKNLNEKKIQK